MIVLSAVIGVLGAVGGFWLAQIRDVSIAGSMATAGGLLFALVFMCAPNRGLVALTLRRRRQVWEFHQRMLVIHLQNHEGLPEAAEECRPEHLHEHLRWNPRFAAQVIGRAVRRNLVARAGGLLMLTDRGRRLARESIAG
jgi:manganese/zinc/iron transport system permease protein